MTMTPMAARPGCCLLLLLCAPAQANQIVVDGGGPDQSNVFLADTDHDLTEAATRLSLADPVTFNELTWWGIYYPGSDATGVDDFMFSIYEDAGVLPGTAVATVHLGAAQREGTGQTVSLWDEYLYTALFPRITLAAGDYFLGLSNNYSGSDLWGWETTAGGPQLGGASYHPGIAAWQPDSSENLAYRLSIPEPGSIALFALGAAGLAQVRRRRR